LRWKQKTIYDFGEEIDGGRNEYFFIFDRIEQLPGDHAEIVVDIAKRITERLKYMDSQSEGTYKMWYASLKEEIPECQSYF
jgi:hypothetical protein